MDIRTVLTINRVTVDIGNELLRDELGSPISLRRQCFAVLRYLIAHANHLVTKEDLVAAVWPDIAVTDDSLVQCVHEIRRALGDDEHKLLKTVSRRGYRLVLSPHAEVAIGPAATPVAAPIRSRRLAVAFAIGAIAFMLAATTLWWSAAGPTRIAALHDPSSGIAVLPFGNIGNDPRQAYLADGITEDLLTDLSRISGLFVIARNSVWDYKKNRPASAKAVAEELGVRYVLDGSVRRDGDRVRITAQLIDTASGRQVWADRYDGAFGDIFGLQDRVIANIVSALAVRLPSDTSSLADAGETRNPQAYDALLLGLERLHLDAEEDTLKAIALFERAAELDPDYGRAYAAIAAAQLRIVLSGGRAVAGAELDKANTSLRSNLAKAMERPTSLAYRVAAEWKRQIGRNNEAFALIEKARLLAPTDPEVLVSEALILNATGKAVEAEAQLRLAMRLDPNFAPATLRALSVALFEQGNYWQALETVGRLKAQGVATTDDYTTMVSSLGQLGVTNGVRDAIDRYNALALPAGRDPMSVQEAQWHWHGDLFSYHRPYVDKLVEGLRKADVPEGAGVDLALDQYNALIKRGSDGEFDVEGVREVDALTAGGLFDRGKKFVDVRARAGYASGHVPRAVNLSLVFDLSKEKLMQVAAQQDQIVFYCHSRYCHNSAIAAAKAVLWGYTRVYLLTGGVPAWKDADCPIEVAQRQ